MYNKSMVIVSESIISKIDEHRGELSRADFVRECIESMLYEPVPETSPKEPAREQRTGRTRVEPEAMDYVTRQEFEQFKRNIDNLQQEFTDFFTRYGKQLAGETLSKKEAERFNEELRRLLQL